MINHTLQSNVTKRYLDQYDTILNTMEYEMLNYMDLVKNDKSISDLFITQMLPHHRGAIEMSENLLKYTTNIPLQNIALDIISGQEKSIDTMLKAQCACENIENTQDEINRYLTQYQIITSNMFYKMRQAKRINNINCDFISEMMPHHNAAIQMSQSALTYTICPELHSILNDIIKSQTEGIIKMTNLYKSICTQNE